MSYKAPHYAVFSSLPPLPPSWVQIFPPPPAPCSQTPANIKKYFSEICSEDGKWMEMAQDRAKWRIFPTTGVEPSGFDIYSSVCVLQALVKLCYLQLLKFYHWYLRTIAA
jgi:hypothetical protein